MTTAQALESALRRHNAGELQQAEQLYRQVLAQEPRNHNALHLLGVLAFQAGHREAAVSLMSQAIDVNPDPEYFSSLGNVLRELGRIDEAIAACAKAVELNGNSATAHNNLGYALQGAAGRLDEAIAEFTIASKLQPNWFLPLRNLGLAYREKGAFAKSIAAYRATLALIPNDPAAHNDLGVVLQADHQLDEAVSAFREGIRIAPDIPEIHNNLGNALHDSAQLAEALGCFHEAIRLRPSFPIAHSNLIYAMHVDPACEPHALLEAHREWATIHAEPLTAAAPAHAIQGPADRKLRIGYVSSDLHDHPIGRFLLPILESHDRAQFEITCFYGGSSADAVNAKLRSACDAWHATGYLSDAQFADLIRACKIDVLFDLACHAPGNRLTVFARKPAPIQMSYLGYPGTTGMSAMDFRITDPSLDPPGENDAFYTEKSLRPAPNYWCYRPIDDAPEVAPLPAERNGFVTFGCLNHFAKTNDPLLGTWGQLLREVPNSRLVLHAHAGHSRQHAESVFKSIGVDVTQIEFVGSQPIRQYLETYNRIDVALDPFPYHGGTTTCDALWMGVPVVTLAGKLAVHRAGVSLLTNVGRTELIARDVDEYVRIARDLANDLPRLAALRRSLRPMMQSSPLCDAASFTRRLEEILRDVWRKAILPA